MNLYPGLVTPGSGRTIVSPSSAEMLAGFAPATPFSLKETVLSLTHMAYSLVLPSMVIVWPGAYATPVPSALVFQDKK